MFYIEYFRYNQARILYSFFKSCEFALLFTIDNHQHVLLIFLAYGESFPIKISDMLPITNGEHIEVSKLHAEQVDNIVQQLETCCI